MNTRLKFSTFWDVTQCSLVDHLVLRRRATAIFWVGRWRLRFLWRRCTRLHCVTSQTTGIFIVSTVRTSNHEHTSFLHTLLVRWKVKEFALCADHVCPSICDSVIRTKTTEHFFPSFGIGDIQ
jgi:hypothetical protein